MSFTKCLHHTPARVLKTLPDIEQVTPGDKSQAGTWWPFRQPSSSPKDIPRITAPQASSAVSPEPHASW